MWFRADIGREGNADPKWLLPFLCRRGHVTRNEIGRIMITARETRFEVAPYAAQRFAAAVRRPPEREDEHLRIEPMEPVRAGAGERAPPYPTRAPRQTRAEDAPFGAPRPHRKGPSPKRRA